MAADNAGKGGTSSARKPKPRRFNNQKSNPQSTSAKGNESKSTAFPQRQKRTSRSGTAIGGDGLKNKRGYSLRINRDIKQNLKNKPSSRRPPQWEKEGDQLYQELSSSSSADVPQTASEARELLAIFEADTDDGKVVVESQKPSDSSSSNTSPVASLWGTLPVGPMLHQRLNQAGFIEPTPIQTAAFQAISSATRPNVLLASPTGSGKSLAYLIPLITCPPRGQRMPGMYFVVTPSVELAAQLKRHVCQFWDDQSLIHVLKNEQIEDDDSSFRFLPHVGNSPIIAGTPKSMRSLLKEMKNALDDTKRSSKNSSSPPLPSSSSPLNDIIAEMASTLGSGDGVDNGSYDDSEMKSKAQEIKNNLCTIVLDEADRLLQTEQVARAAAERSAPTQQRSPPRRLETTVTEQFLAMLPVPISRVQIIGASATVGRTLRRQIMNLVQAPRMDKAATLVTGEGDVRTRKDEARRRASVVPGTLEHRYSIVEGSKADEQRQLDALRRILSHQVPTLVFPGRVGVKSVVEDLTANGFENVRTLSVEMPVSEADDMPPIYVVGDKFGRGLDLPDVRRVVLMSPPSSAAGYTHLAGRTGRNGNYGVAVTLLRPREAPKLAAIAEALGIRLTEYDYESDTSGGKKDDEETDVQSVVNIVDRSVFAISEWQDLTEAAIRRKTVPELREFLDEQKVEYLGVDEKIPRKADLVTMVKQCLENTTHKG